ncbi:MAG: hypothetical protein SOR72_01750 [Hornefia sp.]|nr:hypothetical protein [Hornefia sp.]
MKHMSHEFRWYRITVTISLIALCIVIAVSLYLQHQKNEQLLNNIVGTYQTKESGENSLYIVFTRDNKYTYYKQFKYIDSGKYKQSKDDKRIYDLISGDKKKNTQVVLYGENLYRSRSNNHIQKFIKIDDVPTYLNLKYSKEQ